MIARLTGWTALVWMAGGWAQAEVTPHNSIRVLIIYTNSAQYQHGGGGVNFYKHYFAGVVDAVNQSYEDSETDVRMQIAGVVHDKVYDEYHSGDYPGCENVTDVLGGRNGMGRYVALLDKYAVDYVILVHQNEPGGCSSFWSQARDSGHGAFWTPHPGNAYVWAHEIAHTFNLGSHCHGHRVTLKSNNNFAAGPIPDEMGNITAYYSHHWMMQDTVETEYGPASRGFHTTLAYPDGGSCNSTLQHTYGGITRNFAFWSHGTYPAVTEWTGTFSNPGISWYDAPTNTYHSTGGTIGYIRRLKYHSALFESYRDTIYPYRNEAAMIQQYGDSLIQLRDVPSDLVLTSDMSLGPNEADSQWVYAHFAATNSVEIQPGFSLTGDASMRISVGTSGGAMARRGVEGPRDKAAEAENRRMDAGFRIRYNPATKAVGFSLPAGSASGIRVYVYDTRGVSKKGAVFSATRDALFSGSLSVSELPDGVYFLRIDAGGKRFQRQFFKW